MILVNLLIMSDVTRCICFMFLEHVNNQFVCKGTIISKLYIRASVTNRFTC